MEKLTYSVAEVAAILGVSRPTAYVIVRREDFPALHVGRVIRVPADGLRKWVEEHTGEQLLQQ